MATATLAGRGEEGVGRSKATGSRWSTQPTTTSHPRSRQSQEESQSTKANMRTLRPRSTSPYLPTYEYRSNVKHSLFLRSPSIRNLYRRMYNIHIRRLTHRPSQSTSQFSIGNQLSKAPTRPPTTKGHRQRLKPKCSRRKTRKKGRCCRCR